MNIGNFDKQLDVALSLTETSHHNLTSSKGFQRDTAIRHVKHSPYVARNEYDIAHLSKSNSLPSMVCTQFVL